MKGTQHTFKRYEKKYLLTPEQYGRILPELGREMREDEYGQYTKRETETRENLAIVRERAKTYSNVH